MTIFKGMEPHALRMPRRLAAVLLVLLATFVALGAEEVWHEDEDWSLNLPEGWSLMEGAQADGNLNFTHADGQAVAQVFRIDGRATSFLDGLLGTMKARVEPGADRQFRFNGRPARLINARWTVGKASVRGIVLAIDGWASLAASADGGHGEPGMPPPRGADASWLVLCFAADPGTREWSAELESLIDSFAPGREAWYQPGPVAQAWAEAAAAAGGKTPGAFQGSARQPDSPASVAAAAKVAEREATVLQAFTGADPEAAFRAWRRFYQMLFKDNYARLDTVSGSFARLFEEKGIPRARQPAELLAWVQGFAAETYDTPADLRPPVDAVLLKRGDCDTRALAMAIVLDHLGIDSILLVSMVHKHALLGVDWRGAGMQPGGAVFNTGDREWLVAETMSRVEIGKIAREQADPADWIGFDLRFTP